MSGRALAFFGITGALALAALSFPPIVFVGALFLFVPGLILWAAAPVFMYSLTGYLTWRLTDGLIKPVRVAIMAGVLAALATLPSLYLNQPIERLRASLAADDIDGGVPSLHDKTLAILTPSRSRYGGTPRGDTDCDAICQRLLYNGAAKRVIRGAYPARVPAAEPAVVRAYHVERRDQCPAVNLPDDSDRWQGDPHDYSDRDRDRVRARIAAGECLISQAGTLAEANYELRDYLLRTRSLPRDAKSSDIDDTVEARRIELLERTPQGARVIHRKTQVESRPLTIPFAIANDVHGNHMLAGFLRRKVTDNPYTFTSETLALFGDGVKFPDRNVDAGTELAVLMRALADPTLPATDPRLALADQVLKRIGAKGPASPQDAEAVRLIVSDKRITAFFHLADATWKLGVDAAPLARPLIERLFAARLPQDRDTVQTTSRAIANLPSGAAVAIMDDLEKLAATEGRRGTAYRAIARLGDAGPEAAPRLAALLEVRHGNKNQPHHTDEHSVVIGALLGLCRMGPAAGSAVEPIMALLREEISRDSLSGRGQLAILALGRIGAGERAVELAQGSDNMLKRVQFQLRQAERPLHRDQCSY